VEPIVAECCRLSSAEVQNCCSLAVVPAQQSAIGMNRNCREVVTFQKGVRGRERWAKPVHRLYHSRLDRALGSRRSRKTADSSSGVAVNARARRVFFRTNSGRSILTTATLTGSDETSRWHSLIVASLYAMSPCCLDFVGELAP
jgi:hypothetical protein